MEVQVISRETIKPFSPTPPHLKTFKFSIIDKLVPSSFVPFFCFYSPNQTKNLKNLHQCLKESLSKSLTIFYPFAGRINDDLTIDCNDDGVLYTTACVSSKMVDLLASPQPKIELFYLFMPPLPPFCPNLLDRPSQIGIQVNEFACGGVAICVCFNHLMIDFATISMFVKCWSKIASNNGYDGTNIGIYPAVSLYPQGSEEPMPDGLSIMVQNTLLREGRGTIRRFVFEGSAIAKLKEKAKSELVPNPTRVEAVTGFLWKHLMAVSTVIWGSKQPSVLSHVVNLRRQMMPKMLSEFSIGNIFWMSVALYHNSTTDKARESLEELKEICSDKTLNPYIFTSWCKTGLPDTNFGWGKPIWVSQMGGNDFDSSYKNIIVMMDGQTSDAIEVWVTLGKCEAAALEGDPDFLVFATPNPTISI